MHYNVYGELDRFEVQGQDKLSGDWETIMDIKPAHEYREVSKARPFRSSIVIREVTNGQTALGVARRRAVYQARSFMQKKKKFQGFRVMRFFKEDSGIRKDVIWRDGEFLDR